MGGGTTRQPSSRQNATRLPFCRMSYVTTAWVAPPGAGAGTTTGPTSSPSSSSSILIGGCSAPSWTLVDVSTAASVINLIGCGWDRTACCPFAVAAPTDSPVPPFPTPQGGSGDFLPSQCPADYQAISSGCCPSCVIVLPQIFHSRPSTMDRIPACVHANPVIPLPPQRFPHHLLRRPTRHLH